MILLLIVASGVGAILVSEILGRGKVVYTRMAGLIGSYLVCCAASGMARQNTSASVVDTRIFCRMGYPSVNRGKSI